MNQVVVNRRSLSISSRLSAANQKMAKPKQTDSKTQPYTYQQWMKPQHIGRLKVFHSINTSQLEGHGGHPHGNNHTANDIFEDVFIRRFIMGVFYAQYIPDMGIGIIRRLNEIEIILTATAKHNPFTKPVVDEPGTIADPYPEKPYNLAHGGDIYFKIGFVETILSHQLKRHVTCTVKYCDRNDSAYTYV